MTGKPYTLHLKQHLKLQIPPYMENGQNIISNRGLSQKKKTMQKKALFRTKKSLIPDTLKSVGGIVPFFYMFFFARNTLREVSKKKKKNM